MMTQEEFEQIFEATEEHLDAKSELVYRYAGKEFSFAKIAEKRSRREDLHAFLLLDSLVPGDSDIVRDGEHELIYLATEVEDLLPVITPRQVLELICCGVTYEDGIGLMMDR